jgi:hypothetical protein
MYAHLQEAPPTITAVRDDLPAELDAVVRRALAKRPDDRFGTCTELVGAYREAIDVAPGGERAITAPPSMEGDELRPVSGDGRTIRPPTRSMTPVLEGQRKLVPSRRRVRFWAALSVALVIAGAATVWGLVLQRGGVGPTPSTPPRTRSSPPARQGRIVWQPAVRNPIFRRPDPQVIVRAISTPTGIVAVGYQGSGPTVDPVVWRFDGSSWTRFRVFAGPYGQGIAGVAKGGPGLVGVGTDYSGPDTDAAVWVSRDGGQSWDRVSRGPLTSSGDEYMVRVVKGGPGLVAVGWEKAPNGNTDASVWTSGDSRLWAGVDSATFGGPGEQKMLSAVRFRSGIVAVGDSVVGGNMDAAAWRYDGTNYVRSHSKSLHEPGKQLMAAVAAGPDGLVAVGFDESGPDRDAAVWRSRDGLHWSRVPSRVFGGPDFQEMQGVAWTHAGYVAVGRDVPAGATWSSTDGRHWQEQRPLRLDDRFPRLSAVVEFRGKLYALGRAVLHGDVDAAVWPGKVVHSR